MVMINVDNPHFSLGWQAFTDGLPMEANPFLYEANPYRLFDCGWITAALVDMASRNIHELPKDLWGHVGHTPTLKRIEKSGFVQGQIAYSKGIAFDDCPYEPNSQFAYDWRCGWLWQETHKPHKPPMGISVTARPIYSEFDQSKHVARLAPFAWLARLWTRLTA